MATPGDFDCAKIEEKLTDIQSTIFEIRVIYEAQSKRIEKLENELFGNGRVGLATQVRAIVWMLSGALGFLTVLAAQAISAWID